MRPRLLCRDSLSHAKGRNVAVLALGDGERRAHSLTTVWLPEYDVRATTAPALDTSGAPIRSGMTALVNPANVGVVNSSSMIVPCVVNVWLYCSADRICSPGRPAQGPRLGPAR